MEAVVKAFAEHPWALWVLLPILLTLALLAARVLFIVYREGRELTIGPVRIGKEVRKVVCCALTPLSEPRTCHSNPISSQWPSETAVLRLLLRHVPAIHGG